MKKILSVVIGSILVLGLLSGCAKDVERKAGDAAQKAGEAVQKTAQTVENVGEAVVPDMKQGHKNEQPGQQEKSKFIGEERAKEIALNKAGIGADGVVFDKVELDRDDGVWQYEVEFRKGNTEYDADIKADDGTLLSWDVDVDD